MNLLDKILGRPKSFRPKGDDRFYLDLNGQKLPVDPQFDPNCVDLDVNEDRLVTDEEFQYLAQNVPFDIEPQRYIEEHKYAWTHTLLPELSVYPNYQQVGDQLDELQQKFPDLCQRVSLGKSHEGRELWALHLGSDRSGEKPAVVVTGGTHAREWPSVTVPLHLAETLLSGYATDPDCKRRLDSSEIWIVPLVNPDGYEYSRDHDNTWRKNRNPEHPVDLNRNFDDGCPEHAHLYRPLKDTPGSTYDDKGASDNPNSRTYRGPAGASEPEVKALLDLELNGQVVGVLDNHNCGQMLLYPSAGDKQVYESIAGAMNEAMGGSPYKVMAATDLYEVSGISNDIQQAHGILAMTLESGLSFAPPAEQLGPLNERVGRAHLAFIDRVLAASR